MIISDFRKITQEQGFLAPYLIDRKFFVKKAKTYTSPFYGIVWISVSMFVAACAHCDEKKTTFGYRDEHLLCLTWIWAGWSLGAKKVLKRVLTRVNPSFINTLSYS